MPEQDAGFLEKLGAGTLRRLAAVLYALGYFFEILREIPGFFLRRRSGLRVLTMQMLFTGFEALPVIAVIALGLGGIIVIQGLSLLPQFGQGQFIYTILVIVITRELGPILAAFIVFARSGTAITTEIGNMVINREIEAFIATGINPISYLVVPRFLGVTLSMMLLNVYFNVFGLLGSFFIAQLFQPLPFSQYAAGLFEAISGADIASTMLKSMMFGALIATVSTFYGFRVERSTTEIPQNAIRSISVGFTLLIVANGILTLVYYL
ncbi:MAG: ABC transporter permease [Spirochaeta sp.]|nr:ABC transporter permease [Spirochaeta sp.]